MEHVLTLDVDDAPMLAHELRDDVRAIALFVHDPDYSNQAWAPHNDDAEVRLLTDEDLERGRIEGHLPAGRAGPGRAVATTSVDVPAITFGGAFELRDQDDFETVRAIHEEIYQAGARAGGRPIWLQNPKHEDGTFLFQFDTSFVPMALGDGGIMYVFDDTAFWQCH